MSHRPAVPESKEKLNKFKMEVAHDLHMENQTKEYHAEKHEYEGNMPSKVAGKVSGAGNLGGQMIKKMIASVEKQMINKK